MNLALTAAAVSPMRWATSAWRKAPSRPQSPTARKVRVGSVEAAQARENGAIAATPISCSARRRERRLWFMGDGYSTGA